MAELTDKELVWKKLSEPAWSSVDGVSFNHDGTEVILLYGNSKFPADCTPLKYTLTTPWDLSTIAFVGRA